jgi:glycosyltransferase involved in cell wall biosynthesis
MTDTAAPAGFLRLFVVFHEPEALGAGRSVVSALDALASFGWSTTGWFPGEGALIEEAQGRLAAAFRREKPLRYSLRGWQAAPGPVARLRATPAYLRAFRRALLTARPHVVHANTLRTLPEARVARSLGLPVVIHVHELPAPGAKRLAALRAAALTADMLVVVSEAVARIVQPHAGRTPVLVAHNGIPVGDPVVRAPEPIVGTVGTVCETKGTDIFVEAAARVRERHPEIRFEHIGEAGLDGDAAYQERFAALMARTPGAVELLGRRPARDGLARWEVYVHASRQDAFPLATLEAMAAGVPVIATEVGGVPEQLTHLEHGVLVPPERPDAIADWIVRLHEDPDLRARLGAAGARHVRERFTIEHQATMLHTAYVAALNLRHGPPPVRRRMLELR